MFVRKVRTASGAVAVQVARKVAGRREIVEHVGSAHTDAELGLLIEQANRFITAGQGMFDVEVPAEVVRMDQIADWRAGSGVITAVPPVPTVPGRAVTAGAGRTVGASSRLLFEVLASVYDQLGFGALGDEVFRDLVIARIVEPGSKIDALRVLADLGAEPPAYRTVQRHLAAVGPGNYRDRLAVKCFEHAGKTGGLGLVLYDVTTLYFEAEKEDDLRKVGFSKERRVDPQIVVGLLVDRSGFPLEIGCFEGNTAETRTIVPIINHFRARHDLEVPMIVAADVGMLSVGNLAELDAAGLGFIVGSRTVKAPGDLASHFRWNGTRFTDGQIIDTVTPRTARDQVNDVNKRAEPVFDPDGDPVAWRAIWQYSAPRARRDTVTLNAQEAKARAVVDEGRAVRATRFVKIAGKDRHLDEKALQRARELIGLKGYVTNLPVTTMPAAEVITKYHHLWTIEQSFRMSKTDLRARPMFHRTKDAIEAHLTIVFAALAVSRAVQERTGLAIANVVKQLRPLRTATIEINGAIQDFPPRIPPAQQQILTALQPDPGH
ncbi:IS1634 family transposase [Nakamurella sp. YIM 132087]|uniref:IS1634 family transposase n=1 Tax=Nakamurella alba TaxID=2665158 RepID=A0A7K1FMN9_9ACTN|nr:IS1634 family transposase [Nakamurella alba]MTD15432.1 IS1634 family transposase [Nakamurella alba]